MCVYIEVKQRTYCPWQQVCPTPGPERKILQIRGHAGRQRMFKKIPSTFLSDESSVKVKMKVFRSTYIPVFACGSRERS